MQSDSPELNSLIADNVRRILREYHAPMLAEVVSVQVDDQQRMRADIRPVAKRLQYNEDTEDYDSYNYPVRRNAPVLIPSSEASKQTVKLAAGDLGLWVPLMHSLDGIIDTNITGTVKPQDPRQQAFMDGFFLPTVFNQSVAGEADRYIEGSDVKLGTAASAQALAFLNSVQAKLDALAALVEDNFDILGPVPVPLPSGGFQLFSVLRGLELPPVIPVTAGTVQGTSDVKAS